MGITDITATDLQDNIIAPIIIKEYKEQVTKRMEDGQYMNILSIHTSSVFQDFESFLRTQIDLIEDIKLVLDKYNSSFITYESQPCDYRFKDISEAPQSEYPGANIVIVIQFDDFTRKTKLIVRSGIIAPIIIKEEYKEQVTKRMEDGQYMNILSIYTSSVIDEKSFFSTILGFTPGWDYKHHNE